MAAAAEEEEVLLSSFAALVVVVAFRVLVVVADRGRRRGSDGCECQNRGEGQRRGGRETKKTRKKKDKNLFVGVFVVEALETKRFRSTNDAFCASRGGFSARLVFFSLVDSIDIDMSYPLECESNRSRDTRSGKSTPKKRLDPFSLALDRTNNQKYKLTRHPPRAVPDPALLERTRECIMVLCVGRGERTEKAVASERERKTCGAVVSPCSSSSSSSSKVRLVSSSSDALFTLFASLLSLSFSRAASPRGGFNETSQRNVGAFDPDR